jgi:zinc protease
VKAFHGNVLADPGMGNDKKPEDLGERIALSLGGASWFKNTPAGNHEIIGSETSVRSFTPEALAAFYRGNYRPEKTTLIIVGDMDVETVKRAIEARFSGWERGADAGFVKTQRTPGESDGRTEVMVDPDHKDTELIVATLSASVAAQTQSDFRTYLVRTIVSSILQERFKTLLQGGAQPFFRATALSSSMFHICHVDLLSLGGTQNRWQEIVAAATRELHRASTHGFLPAEMEQGKASVLAGITEAVAREQTRDTRKLPLNSTRTSRPALFH